MFARTGIENNVWLNICREVESTKWLTYCLHLAPECSHTSDFQTSRFIKFNLVRLVMLPSIITAV